MTEVKFTKGPWHIDFTDEIYDSNGNNLADVWLFDIQDPEAAEANANLIAAAPDMYEVLSAINTDDIDAFGNNGDDYCVPIVMTIGQLKAACSALAKARGEQ